MTARLATLLVLSAAFAGCGQEVEPPELGQVKGTVTMDGQPLAGAKVTFNPEAGRPSVGTTDGQGNYELSYTGEAKGAVLGPHTVRIVVAEELPPETGGVLPERSATDHQQTIPVRYNEQTTLKEEVNPGENIIDFDLTSK